MKDLLIYYFVSIYRTFFQIIIITNNYSSNYAFSINSRISEGGLSVLVIRGLPVLLFILFFYTKTSVTLMKMCFNTSVKNYKFKKNPGTFKYIN